MPDSGGWILIPFPNWEGAFGKGAIGLKEFPEGGILGKTISFARTVSRLHIPFRAAYGAYFLILSMFPALLQSPINAGAFCMLAGLVIVPVVSLVTPKMNKAYVEKVFSCYDRQVTVHVTDSIGDNK